MAALEWRVLSEILRTGNLNAVNALGLIPEHFKDAEARAIFKEITNHYNSQDTRGELPPFEYLNKRWPTFRLTPESMDKGGIRTLIKMLMKAVLATDLYSLSETIRELADNEDPEEALTALREMIGGIGYKYERKGGMSMEEVVRRARASFEAAQAKTNYGIPWPWEPLTHDSLGKKPGNFIVFYARPKSMKTWVALKSAYDDYAKYKQRVLWWSGEMDEEETAERIASIAGSVDYQLLLHGELPPSKAAQYLEALDEIESMVWTTGQIGEIKHRRENFIALTGFHAPRTLEGVRSCIEMYEPTIVYLDSFYRMDCAAAKAYRADAEKQRVTTMEVRQLAMEYGIPIVVTSQANRMGEKRYGDTTADIGRTDAASAEATLLVRLIKRKSRDICEEDYEGFWKQQGDMQTLIKVGKLPTKMQLRIAGDRAKAFRMPGSIKSPTKPRTGAELAFMISGSRRGVLEGFITEAIPGYNLDSVTKSDVTATEVKRWLQEDMEVEEEEAKRATYTRTVERNSSYESNRRAIQSLPGIASGKKKVKYTPGEE